MDGPSNRLGQGWKLRGAAHHIVVGGGERWAGVGESVEHSFAERRRCTLEIQRAWFSRDCVGEVERCYSLQCAGESGGSGADAGGELVVVEDGVVDCGINVPGST